MSSTDLFKALFASVGFKNLKWWPNFGTFEVVVGAVLTQNTKWQNVEKSLENLRKFDLMDLEKLANLGDEKLSELIKPSGFYNVKTKRLKTLLNAILAEFGDFESFKSLVSRDWLMRVKGVGAESVDSILCYACEREIMPVDSYTLRILGFLGFEFEFYDDAREWLEALEFDELFALTNAPDINTIFCAYHGLFVEFGKKFFAGKNLSDEGAKILQNLL